VIQLLCRELATNHNIHDDYNLASGYRESVNMAQVRTFIEMDSHEERVHLAVRQTQERDAKLKMREKAKLLSKAQRTQQLNKNLAANVGGSGLGSMGGGSSSVEPKSESSMERSSEPSNVYSAPSKPRVSHGHLAVQPISLPPSLIELFDTF
jgi:hypothetical protein